MIVGSATIFGICPTLFKLTYNMGSNSLLSTFFVCLFAVPILYYWVKKNKQSLKISKETARKLAVLSLGICPTSLLLYSSYSFIPVGMSTILHNIYPVSIAVILAVFYKEKLSLGRILALVFAVSGIIALSGGGVQGGSLRGVFLATLSGITWSFYIVYLDKSGLKNISPSVVHFYVSVASALVSFIACFVTSSFEVSGNIAPVLLIAVIISVLHRVVANSLFQMGLRKTPIFFAGILCTIEPTVAVVAGVVFLSESFTLLQVFGFVLVFICVILNVFAQARGI